MKEQAQAYTLDLQCLPCLRRIAEASGLLVRAGIAIQLDPQPNCADCGGPATDA